MKFFVRPKIEKEPCIEVHSINYEQAISMAIKANYILAQYGYEGLEAVNDNPRAKRHRVRTVSGIKVAM